MSAIKFFSRDLFSSFIWKIMKDMLEHSMKNYQKVAALYHTHIKLYSSNHETQTFDSINKSS
jgi:hypothetical protein